MLTRFILCVMAVIILTFTACKKENEENLVNQQGGPAVCDTSDMKYAANVLPILQSNCYSCHGNGSTEGGISLDGYSNVKQKVDANLLINVITHAPGYPAMPNGLPKLSDCDINKIKAWVNLGALDN
jgi:mono/diheme cytochrome c family protein